MTGGHRPDGRDAERTHAGPAPAEPGGLDFRDMADHAPVMMWVTDPRARCTYLNARWYEFTGQNEATGLGFGWLDAVHPDDRDVAGRVFMEASSKREPFQLDYRLRRADGEYRWAIDAAAPRFGRNREFLGYVGSVIDITERKLAEEALRISTERFNLTVEGAALGVWYCDLPFDVLIWNDNVKEHFHLPTDATVTIETFYSRLHPDDREPTQQAIDQATLDGSTYDIEYRTVSADGSASKWIRAIGRAFYDAHGEPNRFDGITIDITNRKRDEAERERLLALELLARKRAEDAVRARDDFLSIAAHELRTPLATTQAYAQLLARELRRKGSLGRERVERSLDAIMGQTDRLSRLIGNLLDVSRLEVGHLNLERKQTDHALLVEQAVDDARTRSGNEALRVGRSEPVFAEVDALRIGQVLTNLLDNALKYGADGGPIDVALSRRPENWVEVSVRDHGAGISPELRANLFDRFFQAHGDGHRSGMGLGLYISRQIVDQHGGELAAEFPPDGGTRFVVRLPASDAPGARNS